MTINLKLQMLSWKKVATTKFQKNLVLSGFFFGTLIFLLGMLESYAIIHFLPPSLLGKLASAKYFNSKPSVLSIILFAICLVPIFETFLAQQFVIELSKKLGATPFFCGVFSASVFGLGHYINGGLAHGITALLSGLLLAYVYLLYREQGIGQSFIVTAFAHAINNTWVVIMSSYIEF
ncbi:hypothetical protein [Undibacterium sp. TJN19]|uniref:hypothetical protein n=1 Tax=Undibacterium sp. TJN19 TaxID=3413055 RepID=UPI003BF09C70